VDKAVEPRGPHDGGLSRFKEVTAVKPLVRYAILAVLAFLLAFLLSTCTQAVLITYGALHA
jgi:hypothetical protein